MQSRNIIRKKKTSIEQNCLKLKQWMSDENDAADDYYFGITTTTTNKEDWGHQEKVRSIIVSLSASESEKISLIILSIGFSILHSFLQL